MILVGGDQSNIARASGLRNPPIFAVYSYASSNPDDGEWSVYDRMKMRFFVILGSRKKI